MSLKQKLKLYENLTDILKKYTNNKRTSLDYKEYFYLYVYQTASVEGNTFSVGDTKDFLMTNKTNSKYSVQEHNELLDLKAAYNLMTRLVDKKTRIVESVIIDYHKELMKRTDPYQAGLFKKNENYHITSSGERKFYPTLEKATKILSEGISHYLKYRAKEHPLLSAIDLHYAIVKAHPFSDGNGRVARLVFEHIMKNANLPSSFLKEHNRKEYMQSLENSENKKNNKPFKKFIINACTNHLEEEINLFKKIKKKRKRL